MKKILCFIDELGSGGAERQLVGLATMLKNKGYQVDVFCYHPIYFFASFLDDHNVNLIKVPHKPRSWFDKLFWSFKTIKRGRYDFIISYSPGSSFALLLYRIFYKRGKILVSDRNMTPTITLKQRIKFNLYRLADYIVPNSYTQTEILRSAFPFMSNKLYTITNFVNIKYFNINKIKSDYAKNGVLKVLVVARHAIDKNSTNFIKAIQILKQRGVAINVSWYGNFENKYGKDDIEYTKELEVDDCLKFYPPCNNILECYKETDVFCLPSIREGFSNVIGEALSCGLPIVCGNISDNMRMVDDGINGFLFNPNSPESIANAIQRISTLSVEQRTVMKSTNRAKAITMLSEDSFINKYITIIESIR